MKWGWSRGASARSISSRMRRPRGGVHRVAGQRALVEQASQRVVDRAASIDLARSRALTSGWSP